MNPTNNNIKRLSNNEYAVATATNFQDSIIDAGDKVEIKLIYSENIQGTAPTLNLTFGGIESINTPTAGVVHENTITYEYTTATADYGALDINLSGGTIANSSQISSLNVISTAVGNLIRDYAIIDRIQTFDYSGNYKKFTVQKDGYYEIELWGAQGGTIVNSSAGGKGAYTVGTLYMHKDEVYYIYVGQMQNTYNTESFNGG